MYLLVYFLSNKFSPFSYDNLSVVSSSLDTQLILYLTLFLNFFYYFSVLSFTLDTLTASRIDVKRRRTVSNTNDTNIFGPRSL